jgi:hypothetical protein
MLLAELRRRGQLDLKRALVDSASVPALRGGKTGPNPTDRRKAGSKHRMLTKARGIPLTALLTAAKPLRHHATAAAGRRDSTDSRLSVSPRASRT